jgi:MFS superfamily sulfate permease-like transporter
MQRFKQFILNLIPICRWIKSYSLSSLGNDIVAGMTLGTINLPQSMAYALLACLPAEKGLYSTAWSGIVHLIFGISPFMSLGPFAVVALMTGNAVMSLSQLLDGEKFETLDLDEISDEPWIAYPNSIPISEFLTFMIGILLLLIFLLNLGKYLDRLLPFNLIRGFTSAASIAIVCSQLKGLFGVSIAPVTGSYIIGKTLYGIIKAFDKMNWISLMIGLGTILFIILFEKLDDLLRSDWLISNQN